MICALSRVDASATSLANYVSGVGCAAKTSYKEVAAAVQPFYSSYIDGIDHPSENLVFGNPYIYDGADGYKNAVLYQEDASVAATDKDQTFFNGLYYKAPNDKGWTYFKGTRSMLACTAYTVDAVKKAFKGQPCYDQTAKKETTVS
jgi:hypothetical protein